MKTKCTVFALLIGVLLSACGEDPRKAIIGSWKGDSGAQDLHFYLDGSAQIDDHKLDRTYEGHCSIDEEDWMRCDYERLNFPVIHRVEISGKRMTLFSESGQPYYYSRMP